MEKLSKKQIAKQINDPKRIAAIANSPHMDKWLKINPWFGFDKKSTSKVYKIFAELESWEINAKTNKFWDLLDKKLREK